MKKSKFSERQIFGILKQAENGVPVVGVECSMGQKPALRVLVLAAQLFDAVWREVSVECGPADAELIYDIADKEIVLGG